jgi:hypothetical protein
MQLLVVTNFKHLKAVYVTLLKRNSASHFNIVDFTAYIDIIMFT